MLLCCDTRGIKANRKTTSHYESVDGHLPSRMPWTRARLRLPLIANWKAAAAAELPRWMRRQDGVTAGDEVFAIVHLAVKQ